MTESGERLAWGVGRPPARRAVRRLARLAGRRGRAPSRDAAAATCPVPSSSSCCAASTSPAGPVRAAGRAGAVRQRARARAARPRAGRRRRGVGRSGRGRSTRRPAADAELVRVAAGLVAEDVVAAGRAARDAGAGRAAAVAPPLPAGRRPVARRPDAGRAGPPRAAAGWPRRDVLRGRHRPGRPCSPRLDRPLVRRGRRRLARVARPASSAATAAAAAGRPGRHRPHLGPAGRPRTGSSRARPRRCCPDSSAYAARCRPRRRTRRRRRAGPPGRRRRSGCWCSPASAPGCSATASARGWRTLRAARSPCPAAHGEWVQRRAVADARCAAPRWLPCRR